MPLISSLGVMNAINFGLASSVKIISKFFIGNLGSASSYLKVKTILADTVSNVYIVNGNGASQTSVVKLDKDGNLLWKNNYSIIGGYSSSASLHSDNSLYICAYDSNNDIYVTKILENGALAWCNKFNSGSDRGYSTSIYDTSLFAVGSINPSTQIGFLVKLNISDGSLIWQKTYTNLADGYDVSILQVTNDSSGNIFIAGNLRNRSNQSIYIPVILKLDSTGAIVWQKQLSIYESYSISKVLIDSSGNLYIAASQYTSNSYLVKLDSTGTVIWSKALTSKVFDSGLTSLAIDSASNVYLSNTTAYVTTYYAITIIKFDSSGNTQWQRQLTSIDGNTGQTNSGSISIDKYNNILVGGYVNMSSNAMFMSIFAKLPNDGSLTGNYPTIANYTVGSVTISDGTITTSNSTISLDVQTASMTTATPTTTTLTYSPYIKIIP